MGRVISDSQGHSARAARRRLPTISSCLLYCSITFHGAVCLVLDTRKQMILSTFYEIEQSQVAVQLEGQGPRGMSRHTIWPPHAIYELSCHFTLHSSQWSTRLRLGQHRRRGYKGATMGSSQWHGAARQMASWDRTSGVDRLDRHCYQAKGERSSRVGRCSR